MKKIIVHIGLSKTGSSALQAYLTFNPDFELLSHGQKLIYCCLLKDGTLCFGKELQKHASKNNLPYMSSFHDLSQVLQNDALRKSFEQLWADGFTPILSQEDWWRQAHKFQDIKFFESLGCNTVDIIVYVRPQIEWFNSAWWQWFTWMDEFDTPEDVVKKWGYDFLAWGKHLATWRKLTGKGRLLVREFTKDIVLDFLSLVDIHNATNYKPKKVNTSNGTLIKLLKAYPTLRKVHDADVDAILSKHFSSTGKPPWVITEVLANNIVDSLRKDNELLLSLMGTTQRELMITNRRWWDAAHYSNNFSLSSNLSLSESEKDIFLQEALVAILSLEGKNIKHMRSK